VEGLLERPATRPAPDALFTSTLSRATNVAAVLGHAWTLDPQTAQWAREIHCGLVEGMPLERLQREFPDLWARNEAQADDTFAWPGGETYAQFRTRIVAGLQEASSTHEGGEWPSSPTRA
jgi:probable phosphoglycerate mutase